jgi:hypothetical protein
VALIVSIEWQISVSPGGRKRRYLLFSKKAAWRGLPGGRGKGRESRMFWVIRPEEHLLAYEVRELIQSLLQIPNRSGSRDTSANEHMRRI